MPDAGAADETDAADKHLHAALLDHFANGGEAEPVGNADPFGQYCPNEVYRCGDRVELAITCRDDDEWRRLCETVGWGIADLAADQCACHG